VREFRCPPLGRGRRRYVVARGPVKRGAQGCPALNADLVAVPEPAGYPEAEIARLIEG